MPRMNLEDCRNDWRKTAADLTEITGRISSLTTRLLLSTMEADMVPQEQTAILSLLSCLNTAETALSGMSYLCSPQSEWLGGNRSVYRAPHIVNG